jgi:hypothetical protein
MEKREEQTEGERSRRNREIVWNQWPSPRHPSHTSTLPASSCLSSRCCATTAFLPHQPQPLDQSAASPSARRPFLPLATDTAAVRRYSVLAEPAQKCLRPAQQAEEDDGLVRECLCGRLRSNSLLYQHPLPLTHSFRIF